MYYKTVELVSELAEKDALVGMHEKFLVCLHPVLFHAVDEEIRIVNSKFTAEPHLQTDLIADFLRVLIAEEVAVYAVLPGKVARDCGVCVKEVVGDKNAIVPRSLVSSCHIRSRSGRARASLFCVEMSFVFVHYIYSSVGLFVANIESLYHKMHFFATG